MINPEAYARVPGAGPKMTQWVGQVKAGRRVVVRADVEADAEAAATVLLERHPALLLEDVGDVEQWPKALERCLKRFPTAAGRLRQVKKDRLAPVWPSRRLAAEGLGWKRSWKIFLNNAGVPFTAASVPPCGLPTPEVLQLACQDDQCGFFDTGLAENGEEDPLLRLKLIHEEGTAKGRQTAK
eukprot:g13270.t1